MKAVVYPEPNRFEIKDVDIQEPSENQVLIKVMSTTICATDFKIFGGLFPGTKFPHIPGHEWSGVVEKVGGSVKDIKKGDRVGVEVHVGCGFCEPCLKGLYNICENYGNREVGHAHIGFTVNGGMAEYCTVPKKAVHIIPDSLGFDEGAFTDNIGVTLYSVERGGLLPGESVAVVGPGAFGLLAVQIAKAMGAGKIILIGTRQERLELGRNMGADETVNIKDINEPVEYIKNIFNGKGADLVIEFAGTESAANLSIQIAKRGGRVVLAGSTAPGRNLNVDLSLIVRGNLDVYGSLANPKGISNRGLELMRKKLVDVKPLITHHFRLEEFGKAWDTFKSREGGAYRVMIHPE